jgi:hypothetical protein
MNRTTPPYAAGPLWLLAVLLAGCATSSPASPSSASSGAKEAFPNFNVIRLYNDSDADIFDIELSAGATVTTLARLPAGHSPVSDRGVSPDPATASVAWRTADGRRFTKEVRVANELPRNFRGVIVLRLQDTGDIAVTCVRYEDLK